MLRWHARGLGLLIRLRLPLRNGHDARTICGVQEVEANLDEKEDWDLLVSPTRDCKAHAVLASTGAIS